LISPFSGGVAGRVGVDPYVFWNNFVQGRDNAGPGTLNAWTPTNTNTGAISFISNDTDVRLYLEKQFLFQT
jgi:hypothetical protein